MKGLNIQNVNFSKVSVLSKSQMKGILGGDGTDQPVDVIGGGASICKPNGTTCGGNGSCILNGSDDCCCSIDGHHDECVNV